MQARQLLLIATIALATLPSHAQTRQVSLKSGESADIGAVYWVKNCQSSLKKITGVDVLEGDAAGLQLSVREEPVQATRQNCPEKVPGGVVVVSTGAVQEKRSTLIKYRVRYDTLDGLQQSTHTVSVDLFP
ncbi:MAG: hypothetical protein LBE61_21205 [Burkholderiaceae bacterium]|jgi:hypothetical protein|nr:hypothetical protein [Burkholderiaceae bacterium]